MVRCHAIDEFAEDVRTFEVSLIRGAVLLSTKDREKLRPCRVKATALADRLVGAIELRWSSAVPVAELAEVAKSSITRVVINWQRTSDRLDSLGGLEVLLRDVVVRDARIDERHAR